MKARERQRLAELIELHDKVVNAIAGLVGVAGEQAVAAGRRALQQGQSAKAKPRHTKKQPSAGTASKRAAAPRAGSNAGRGQRAPLPTASPGKRPARAGNADATRTQRGGAHVPIEGVLTLVDASWFVVAGRRRLKVMLASEDLIALAGRRAHWVLRVRPDGAYDARLRDDSRRLRTVSPPKKKAAKNEPPPPAKLRKCRECLKEKPASQFPSRAARCRSCGGRAPARSVRTVSGGLPGLGRRR